MLSKPLHKNILMHFFFVSLFLVIPTLAFVRPPGESGFAFTQVFVQDTTANFVLLCFFYLNYYLLLPKFYFRRKYILYILLVVIFLSFAFILPRIVGEIMHGHGEAMHDFGPGEGPMPLPDDRGPGSLVSFVFDEFRRHLGLFFTAVFFSFLLRTREYLSELKEDKLNAELSSLKSQINPHFLFNTLNSIYALSVKKDDKTPDAIINLSGLMRYVISDADNNRISLQKEIDYINNYIELQKARLGNTVTIRFECTGEAEAKEIAPLILITYIENAFKYGVNPDADDCLVEVKLHITDTVLNLFVFNNIIPLPNHLESTGIGIVNTAERLNLLYPNKHNIQIKEDDKAYSVNLSITLV